MEAGAAGGVVAAGKSCAIIGSLLNVFLFALVLLSRVSFSHQSHFELVPLFCVICFVRSLFVFPISRFCMCLSLRRVTTTFVCNRSDRLHQHSWHWSCCSAARCIRSTTACGCCCSGLRRNFVCVLSVFTCLFGFVICRQVQICGCVLQAAAQPQAQAAGSRRSNHPYRDLVRSVHIDGQRMITCQQKFVSVFQACGDHAPSEVYAWLCSVICWSLSCCLLLCVKFCCRRVPLC